MNFVKIEPIFSSPDVDGSAFQDGRVIFEDLHLNFTHNTIGQPNVPALLTLFVQAGDGDVDYRNLFFDIPNSYVESLGMDGTEGGYFILSSKKNLGDFFLYAIQDPRVREILAQGELGEEGIQALEEFIASHT